ncbi:MAG: ABC transporter ATP-binding protein, partial [Giesbergeria sp.]
SMALQADDVAVLADGCLQHHGAAHEDATHRALEAVFDQRITIHRVQDQWLALPRLHAPEPIPA